MVIIKLPWKKNFLKIPDSILVKSKELKSDLQIVGSVKKILLTDIKDNVYSHIGISISNSEIDILSPILPRQSTGRYSNYNVNGRTIIRRDLPKVDKSYSVEAPNFGDWSKGSHDMSWTRPVFQRTHWLPREIHILVEVLENDESSVTIKFSLDHYIDKQSSTYEEDLLFHCNLLQENTGVCNIFEADATNDDYINTLYVNWEIFPPGEKNIEHNVAYLISKFRNPTKEIQEIIADRVNFFEALNPIQYIVGESKFSQYIGAMLKENLVLLENVRYGNAIYILFENWKQLSKLSRTELLNSNNRNFVRITHRGNWKNKVVNAIR
ncbi:hypothetical protein D7Z26_21785 [Cohnella endophytica]|uniref:Uncharacterized protein n=1 Tax=Cohnella endophytica TaxID=2419778 RepID=A0A494XBC2_9BACL|nr:hypothetical protein [Cohnella endophytica]RKP47850.1 hypothetical protein D7Z26_21785 [Cohnella endophytica]